MGYDLTCLTIPEPPQHELERLIDEATDRARRKTGDPGAAGDAAFDAMEATGAYFHFNFVAWPKALELARFYGWEPEHDETYYHFNDGQVVSAADANNLATALERAVESLAQVTSIQPSYGVLPPHQKSPLQQAISRVLGVDITVGPREELSPEAFWADNADTLRRFIRFARQGAIWIH